MPIIEPEVDIHSPEKAAAEALLKAAILRHLDALGGDDRVMLKLSLPTEDGFYADLVDHPKVIRVVALSGGYPPRRGQRDPRPQPGHDRQLLAGADRGPHGAADRRRVRRRPRHRDRRASSRPRRPDRSSALVTGPGSAAASAARDPDRVASGGLGASTDALLGSPTMKRTVMITLAALALVGRGVWRRRRRCAPAGAARRRPRRPGATAATGATATARRPPPASRPTAFAPVTIEHAFGVTTFDAPPQRIATSGCSGPTSSWRWGRSRSPTSPIRNAGAGDIYPWQAGLLDDSTGLAVTSAQDIPFEQLAALDPDLILVTYLAEDQAIYDRLTASPRRSGCSVTGRSTAGRT